MVRTLLGVSVVLSAFGGVRNAHALQPLEQFVASSRMSNPDNRALSAVVAQRDAEAEAAKAQYLPSFTAQGSYVHNQYELEVSFPVPNLPSYLLVPQNQVDGLFTIAIPIIQIAAWRGADAALAVARASAATRASTQLVVERGITGDYYTLIAAEAVLSLARQNSMVSDQNRKLVEDRHGAGLASELDLQRATADVARAKHDIASSERAVISLRRNIETLSGVTAEPVDRFAEDALQDEAPLEVWMGRAGAELVAVRSAVLQREAAERAASAADAAWYPTLGGQAQERITNATGFLGNHSSAYSLGLTATWKVDLTISPTTRAKRAAAAAARAVEDKSRREAEDAVYLAWHDVEVGIAQARAARAQVTATQLALGAARDRYLAGNATQLDVVQSQRDAFSADVARAQADATLQFSRAMLRLSTRISSEEPAR